MFYIRSRPRTSLDDKTPDEVYFDNLPALPKTVCGDFPQGLHLRNRKFCPIKRSHFASGHQALYFYLKDIMSNQKISATPTPDLLPFALNERKCPNSASGKEASIMLSMLTLLCFIVFHKFILGFAVYLFKDMGSDTLNFYYPFYINISEILRENGLPGWSFEQGLGQNVFPFSLSDPTTYLLYLLGSDNLSFGIIWVEILKITCSGLLFFCFLKKLKLDTNAAYIGGLLYAFSGFMIVGGGWYIFSTLGLYTALILLSFEMLYAEKKWWLFPISVALIAAYNFVSLYTCSVFLLLYILFRVLAEQEINLKKLPSLFLHLLLLGALGVLLSAVLSIPNLLQMIDSPRVSGNASLTNELSSIPIFESGNRNYLVTLLMRTFSSDLLGNGNAYKGWNSYLESPMSYCGLISLLLVPQMFNFLKARQRIVYGTFIGIFIFAEIFPWFRRGFWLFLGDYFRDLSLYVSIIFILFSIVALDNIIKGRKVNLLLLGVSLATLLLLLYFPYDLSLQDGYGETIKGQSAIDHGIQAKIVLFLALIAANLILFSFWKPRKYAQLFLLAITFVELASFSYDTVNKRDVVTTADLHKKTGYNDHSVEAIAFIKQQDKDFFRIEKNYGSSPAMHASLNDSKVQHYFGSSSYSSFNQLNYINFLSTCDALNSNIESDSRYSIGVKNEPLLQILTGVRYLLFKGDWRSYPALTDIYAKIADFDEVTVLKSKYALPMGVAYDAYMVQSDFIRLDTNRKQIALLKAIMIPDGLASDLSSMARISGSDLPAGDYSSNELAMDTDKLKANSLHITSFSNNGIDGEINTKIKQLVFFSFPFDKGWKAKVNGNEVAILMVDGGLSALLTGPGNNVISLRYSPPFVEKGLYLTLLGLLIFVAMMFRSAACR